MGGSEQLFNQCLAISTSADAETAPLFGETAEIIIFQNIGTILVFEHDDQDAFKRFVC
jgi:hypothetical protein